MIDGRYGETRYNDFHTDLQYSLDSREDKQLDYFYLTAFPHAERVEMVSYEDNPELQKKGVDKIIHFANGRRVTVDEKKRRKDYGDILLEIYSNAEQKSAGWLFYSQCDYIVYAILPAGKIYLLPVLLLQMAWKKNRYEWWEKYPQKYADNKYYHTMNIAIPTEVLLTAIRREMTKE